ncbi:MAG: hypothetical protein Kow00108_23040 [Calditrichia bacterium]
MPVAGVVILADNTKVKSIYQNLQKYSNITTYGVHHENQIVAVFEADSSNELELMSEEIKEKEEGILGIFPAYVNFEDEVEG